jgi:hydroxymethylpyrimidine/phosphomethylpyrimidine kinase
MQTPAAITVAGSDSSSGAGIQADLKTFSHFGVYALTVVTCVVAEVPGIVSSIQAIDLEMIRRQLALNLVHFPIAVIKTGMLYSAEVIDLICDMLEALEPRVRPMVVVDPVMIATSGEALIQPGAIEEYASRLFPLATIVTPNLHEASVLLNRQLKSFDEMRDGATELYKKYRIPFLVKGGHLQMAEATDLLVDREGIRGFSAAYQRKVSTHGTGCAYSAAIAANLALNLPLRQAVDVAKQYITAAIRESFRWSRNGRTVFALRHSPGTGGGSDFWQAGEVGPDLRAGRSNEANS